MDLITKIELYSEYIVECRKKSIIEFMSLSEFILTLEK